MLRFLRVAASVICFLACAAFGVLWFRSYSWSDSTWSRDPYASIWAFEGRIFVRFTGNPLKDPIWYSDLVDNVRSDRMEPSTDAGWWEEKSFLGFACFEMPPGGTWIHFPHWAPLLLSGALGATLALNRPIRFSVRAALILMTAVAVAMGLGLTLRH